MLKVLTIESHSSLISTLAYLYDHWHEIPVFQSRHGWTTSFPFIKTNLLDSFAGGFKDVVLALEDNTGKLRGVLHLAQLDQNYLGRYSLPYARSGFHPVPPCPPEIFKEICLAAQVEGEFQFHPSYLEQLRLCGMPTYETNIVSGLLTLPSSISEFWGSMPTESRRKRRGELNKVLSGLTVVFGRGMHPDTYRIQQEYLARWHDNNERIFLQSRLVQCNAAINWGSQVEHIAFYKNSELVGLNYGLIEDKTYYDVVFLRSLVGQEIPSLGVAALFAAVESAIDKGCLEYDVGEMPDKEEDPQGYMACAYKLKLRSPTQKACIVTNSVGVLLGKRRGFYDGLVLETSSDDVIKARLDRKHSHYEQALLKTAVKNARGF